MCVNVNFLLVRLRNVLECACDVSPSRSIIIHRGNAGLSGQQEWDKWRLPEFG